MGDGLDPAEATALEETDLLTLPAGRFHALAEAHPALAAFFARPRPSRAARPASLAETRVEALMSPDPVHLPARDHHHRKPPGSCATAASPRSW